MTLGERIVGLRTRRKLSQEELADLLGVSRQSVSKWETDASVPELDKLVKLGEVFGVSLDELVKGNAFIEEQEPVPAGDTRETSAPRELRPAGRGNRAAGLAYLFLGLGILTVLTLYGGFVIGLVFCLPFVACGVLCLTLHVKRMGLWCGWALYFLVDLYLFFGTGLRWTAIFQTLQWTARMNYVRLLVAWLQFLLAVALVVLTALSWRREPLALNQKGKSLYICGWAAALLVWFGGGILLQGIWRSAVATDGRLNDGRVLLYQCVVLARDWGLWVLLAVLLTVGARAWLGKKRAG